MNPTPELDDIIKVLADSGEAVSTNELLKIFQLEKVQRTELRRVLKQLEKLGKAENVRGKYWQIPQKKSAKKLTTGLLMISKKGLGFVRPSEPIPNAPPSTDLMISESDLSDAMDGDTVVASYWEKKGSGYRGRIEHVEKRGRETIIGQFQKYNDKRGIVTPRNHRIGRRISVPLPAPDMKIDNFEWVSVKITEFTRAPEDLQGTIVERIGGSHEEGIDVLLLLRDRGIEEEFPEYVEKAANALEQNVEAELPNRWDLRQLPTATIDPATAKDFDDALSIEPLKGGGWKLYVHIADVTHYVTHDDLIDIEARQRSTSVYPVDRVVPMLPEKLCNDLCSLRPNVDRFAMTAEMDIAVDGKVTRERFHASIIHSDHRFAYEEAQALLEGEEGAGDSVPKEIQEAVPMLRDCARALRQRRFGRGALDLDIPESRFVLDTQGRLEGFRIEERFEAHKLVEDCMLAANEAVARFLNKHRVPALYRVHEVADPDRLLQLREVLHSVGVNLPMSKKGEITSFDLQKGIDALAGKKGGHILRRLMLRAMKRAEYSPENRGHFGLASEHYCHFTSPIRRYPDVVVHRQLKEYLAKKKKLSFGNVGEEKNPELALLAQHTSHKEREAADAEYDSQKIKMIEYFKDQIGEVYQAQISGTTGQGFFVEVQPSGLEGFVHVRSLRGDHFEQDEFGVAIVGQKTGKRYQLTDEVSVRLVRADPFELKVDFELEATDSASSRPTPSRRSKYSPPEKSGSRKRVGPPKGKGKKRRK